MDEAVSRELRYGDEASILLITDSEDGEARGRSATEAIGMRIRLTVPPDQAEETLGKIADLDLAVVDIENDHGATLDALIARLNERARAGRHRSVITVPIELVDAVEARVSHRDVTVLCAPDALERVAALQVALANAKVPVLRDSGSVGDETRLFRLSEEVGRIARALAELSNGDPLPVKRPTGLGAPSHAYKAQSSDNTGATAEEIRSMIKLRRLRDRFFDGELFADPAWDMLLDLMVSRIENRPVAVSSLCIAAAVPPTTALRWIKSMTDSGLFVRNADPRDGRRVFIELADEAAHAMDAWFAAARSEAEIAAA